MKVSGFTFIKNAVKYDYPIIEAISSILPLCDEVLVALGNSEDDTDKLIATIKSPKIRTIKTTWDDSLRKGGQVLAAETNKAFSEIKHDSDWAFYIQGDEVVHEKYYDEIKSEMEKWKDDKQVDGLLFNYKHFYGSYNYLGDSAKWYRKEIRIIKNDKKIYSYKDAQGFRKNENKKLQVKPIDAAIHHYGWVKDPRAQQEKQKTFNKLWHNDDWVNENVSKANEYDYNIIDSLELFQDTHPSIMKNRIERLNWDFSFDSKKKKFTKKDKLRRWIEKITGYRIGEYKNYLVI